MKIITWNLNNRAPNQKAWELIFDCDPDLALISEVNYVPADLRGFSFCAEVAMGHNRKPRQFRIGILTKGRIGSTIGLVPGRTG